MRKIITLSLLFICISCDCWTDGIGVVLDEETKLPIDSVKVSYYADDKFVGEMYTDSIGLFYGGTGNTGACKDLLFEFSKLGYESTQATISKNKGFDSITIYLAKKKYSNARD